MRQVPGPLLMPPRGHAKTLGLEPSVPRSSARNPTRNWAKCMRFPASTSSLRILMTPPRPSSRYKTLWISVLTPRRGLGPKRFGERGGGLQGAPPSREGEGLRWRATPRVEGLEGGHCSKRYRFRGGSKQRKHTYRLSGNKKRQQSN